MKTPLAQTAGAGDAPLRRLGDEPQPTTMHGHVETVTPEAGTTTQATRSLFERIPCWLLLSLLAVGPVLISRAGEAPSAEPAKRPASAPPNEAAASTNSAQAPMPEGLGCVVIDGKTNKIVSVVSADPIQVFVVYETAEGGKGGRKIPRQDLPPQLQKKYPYDEAKAAEYRRRQAGLAAERRILSLEQAARTRAAAREVLRQQERDILGRIDALNKQDVELQKERNRLDSLPRGNGRRVRSQQISNTQESIREHVAQLRKQADQIRSQIEASF